MVQYFWQPNISPMSKKDQSFCYNSFNAHGECVLISLFGSDGRKDREFNVNKIIEIRSKPKQLWRNSGGVRPFKRPKVNFEATLLYNLNTLPSKNLKTEPPLTSNLTDESLQDILDNPPNFDLPLSTTAVERAVKQVTAASSKCADPKEQDGSSFLALSAREKNSVANRNKRKYTS